MNSGLRPIPSLATQSPDTQSPGRETPTMPLAIVPADLPTRRPRPVKPRVQLTPHLPILPTAFRFSADAHTPAASMPRQSTIQTIAWKTGTMIHRPTSTNPATMSASDTEAPTSTARSSISTKQEFQDEHNCFCKISLYPQQVSFRSRSVSRSSGSD